jgi:3-hydroxy-3-methylglutaryl CoA synthase
MLGIVGYGAYIPRLRLSRKAVVQANAWYAPQLAAKAKGTRAVANWDEDSITMSVAAARDCLGADADRVRIHGLYLASCTVPFAERSNAGIVSEALLLDESVDAVDITGSPRAALSAVAIALAKAPAAGPQLVLAADLRHTRAASTQELEFGDGAAALLLGSDGVIAEYLGGGTLSVDFVDHFRVADAEVDYAWEERWVRDEGIGKLMPRAIAAALTEAGIDATAVDHFIFPSTIAKLDAQLAGSCGIRPDAVVDNLAAGIGDTGTAHALLMLSYTLERARPGQVIVVSQFGSGAQALVFRVTAAIAAGAAFLPVKGVGGWLARGVEETSYTKFLAFRQQLTLERGMRGEQDKKTALSTLYRHRRAILGFVAGRCAITGDVHFPPSRISYTPGAPALDTQKPYPLAERQGTVLSWSAEYLSYYPAPPQYYGQVDFDGGGRVLMEFVDVSKGDIESGTRVEMVFRIKDFDEKRGFIRYFWKATPVRETAEPKVE